MRSARQLSLLAFLLALPVGACKASASDAERTSRYLDGSEKSFVVVGYSTSFAWPVMLQEMLDEHAVAPGVYHVLNATAGGAAVEVWIAEPGSDDYERTMGAMDRDFFGGRALLNDETPSPTIALCQQSLQFTLDRRGPVKTQYDVLGAEKGADVMEQLAGQLRELGVERVIYAMHIYKQPVEPEVGNERIALARLLARDLDYIDEGPDVWTPTRDRFPDCFDEDGVHPNELGMKIMAEGWYRTLAGPSTREEIVEHLYATDYDVDAMMRDYLAWREGGVAPR